MQYLAVSHCGMLMGGRGRWYVGNIDVASYLLEKLNQAV
jgi:hypothetical protein